MKPHTPASLKKINAENLARLGLDRLAEILVASAEGRPELKRRLRMELAAEQGPEQLALEIDKRLAFLEASRSKVSWRQRPTFVRDVDTLRDLIAVRLAELDPAAALDRMWPFMDIARRLGGRVRDRDGELAAVFHRAAEDIGRLLATSESPRGAAALIEAIARDPSGWADWLAPVLKTSPGSLADAALRQLAGRRDDVTGWVAIARRLADAAGDVDAYRSTYAPDALLIPSNAAEVGNRLLAAGRIDEAGAVLTAAGDGGGGARTSTGKPRPAEPDFEWESAWIDYLDRSGQPKAAQAARWASFERTLSAERLRDFSRRLKDFEDVEAEGRALELAKRHHDVGRSLQFLFDWPALAEAARLIQAKADDIGADADKAIVWAARLASRHPEAANTLLRRAATAAFRRRDFAACDRLTQEADTLTL